jgi:hypothetical protein
VRKHWLKTRVEETRSLVMHRRTLLLCLTAAALGGCIHVKMDPIQVNATIDVNVKVDRALEDLFGDLDKKDASMKPAAK